MSDPTLPGMDPWKLAHLAWAAAVGVVAWVARDHFARDDARFTGIKDEIIRLNQKLDESIKQGTENHAEVLKILIDRLPPK